MTIIHIIEESFDGLAYPDDWLRCGGGDDDDVKELRNYRDWRAIPNAVIERGFLALPILSAKAFQFVLPAYLRAVLRNFPGDSPVSDTTIYSLNPYKKGKLDEFSLGQYIYLTEPQRNAIVQWLEFLLCEHADEIDDVHARAALKYWKDASCAKTLGSPRTRKNLKKRDARRNR